ncbi:MAG: LysM peptidoglycan-binding domain-containing protein [Gemmatimonadales bacterium]
MPARPTSIRSYRRSLLALTAVLAAGLPARALAQGVRASSHTVKKGDTLWDIAGTYLGDPFKWPLIYRLNTSVVEDPHWIYPGEVLRLEGDTTVAAVPSAETPAPAAPPAAAPATPEVQAPMPPSAADTGDGYGMELFRRRHVANLENVFKTYRDVKPPLLRETDFHSSGFLTEGDTLPFGRLLGPVTPEPIETVRARAAAQHLARVAVLPPPGGTYAPGDSLLSVVRLEGPVGYGEIVVPTGIIRVTGQNGDQVIGEVIQIYGPVRDGQSILPAEKFKTPTAEAYQPVSDGMQGRVLIPRDPRNLRQPGHILFLDIGSSSGVVMGDLYEARRDPGPQPRAEANAVDELMATMQVVHVRERTATVRVVNLLAPDVHAGTRVKHVARLP